jgi:cation diffusion facilitator CzcD-associated flavoprotein CzcO
LTQPLCKNPWIDQAYEKVDRFKFIIKDSDEQKDMFQLLTAQMSNTLHSRPDLMKALIPDFAVGCRRLTPAPGFLEALLEPNVETVLDTIERIYEDGIVTTDGRQHKFDVIICATGTGVLRWQ